MISNYVVKLLIFLLMVLLIGQLSNKSLFTIFGFNSKSKEGMDNCSQNKKDELYKQRTNINELKKKNASLSSKIRNLETKITNNKQLIKKNSDKVKSVVSKSKGDSDKASQASESIKM